MPYYFQFILTEGTSHEENWSFYPNAVRTAGFCGNPSFHLYWPNKKKDKTHNALSSRELIIQPGYMMQFKVRGSGSSRQYGVTFGGGSTERKLIWTTIRKWLISFIIRDFILWIKNSYLSQRSLSYRIIWTQIYWDIERHATVLYLRYVILTSLLQTLEIKISSRRLHLSLSLSLSLSVSLSH